MTSPFIEPLRAHPFLITIILMAAGGVMLYIAVLVRALRHRAHIPITAALLLFFFSANMFLFFIMPGPIPLRHLRELYALSAPFAALFLMLLLRHTPKIMGAVIISLILVIGITTEFTAFSRYEKNNYIDWSYLNFFDWAEKNLPANASVLTDPFTFHELFAALPYIQGPKQRNIAVSLDPSLDPRLTVFEGKPEQLPMALAVLCPSYVIIDRASTGQFYPVVLQDRPEQFGDLLAPIYNRLTSKSHITVFKVHLPYSCYPN